MYDYFNLHVEMSILNMKSLEQISAQTVTSIYVCHKRTILNCKIEYKFRKFCRL